LSKVKPKLDPSHVVCQRGTFFTSHGLSIYYPSAVLGKWSSPIEIKLPTGERADDEDLENQLAGLMEEDVAEPVCQAARPGAVAAAPVADDGVDDLMAAFA
jgi:hypothetical protein